jgi:hypothetical protein
MCDFFEVWVGKLVENWGFDWCEAFKNGQTSYDLAARIWRFEHGMTNEDLGHKGIYKFQTFQYHPSTYKCVLLKKRIG